VDSKNENEIENKLNLYITTTKRNLILTLLKNSDIILKKSMGQLNIKAPERKAPYASRKLAYIFGYILLKEKFLKISVYINS